MLANNLAVISLQSNNLGPCTLEGKFVRLEPLREQHAQDLARIAAKQDWSLMLYPLLSKGDVEKRIKIGMDMEKRNEEYALAVVLKNEKRIIGSTSYLTIVPRHKRAEIGSTWYSSEFQGILSIQNVNFCC